LRILFVSRRVAPLPGGAEALVEDLARGFARRGHDVRVLADRADAGVAGADSRHGFEIHRLAFPVGGRKAWRTLVSLPVTGARFVVGLGRQLRRSRPDVVCVGLAGLELVPLLLWRRIFRFRLVVLLHGGELRRYARVSPYFRWALRAALRRCDRAVAVSGALRDEAIVFEPRVASRLEVIENGVDVALFRGATPQAAPRPYVLFAGRLDEVKGLETLVRGFAVAARRVDDLDLVIVGDGAQGGALRRLAAELGVASRVRFAGAARREEVAAYLAGCELAVLASSSEGSPLFLLEAQAAGRMLLGSDVVGIAERLEPGVSGDLFRPGDAQALGDALCRWHRDAAGRQRIEAHLLAHPPRSIDPVCDEYLSVMSGRQGPLSVGFVSSFFYRDADNSGLSAHYHTLASSLVELGHRVRLVTCPESLLESVANGIEMVATGVRRSELVPSDGARRLAGPVRRGLARLRFAWQAARAIRRLDRGERFDVVVAPELFAPGLFLAVSMRDRLVTRLHTPTAIGERFNRPGRAGPGLRLATALERWQARRSRGLSAATSWLRDAVAADWRLDGRRIRVIPNGVRVEWVRELGSRQEREIEGTYLVYFGRLERRKGVHRLIEALDLLLARRRGLRAVVAGRDWGLGGELARSAAAVGGRLEIFDTLPPPRLFGIVRHATLVVLPSLFENAPNAALEAMALGRPVVATRGTGFDDLITHGESGFLVEPDDGAALTAGVEAALDSPDLEAIGARGLAHVRRFEALAVARSQAEFYREIAPGR